MQAFITYGRQGNDRLLQFYGFVETNNPADTYVIRGLDAAVEVHIPLCFGRVLCAARQHKGALLQLLPTTYVYGDTCAEAFNKSRCLAC